MNVSSQQLGFATMILLLVVIAIVALRRGVVRPYWHIPSPRSHPIAGHYLQLLLAVRLRAMRELILAWQTQCPKIFITDLIFRCEVNITDVDTIRSILTSGQQYGIYSRRGPLYLAYASIYGKHFGNQDGAPWKKRRETWNDIIGSDKFLDFGDCISSIAISLIRNIQNNPSSERQFSFDDIASEFHLSVILTLLIGKNAWVDTSRHGFRADLLEIIASVSAIEQYAVLRWIPGGRFTQLLNIASRLRLKDAQKYLRATLFPLVQNAHQSGVTKNGKSGVEEPVEPLLVQIARKSNCGPEQLYTELQAILFPRATSRILSCAMVELAKNQSIQLRLRQEFNANAALNGESSTSAFQHALIDLEYLQAFVKEVVRSYSPIPLICVSTLKDTCIHGYLVPSNTIINLHLAAASSDSDSYRDPLIFNPDRWMSAMCDTANILPAPVLLGFSLGRHSCLAYQLSLLEVKIVIYKLLQHYNISTNNRDSLYTGVISLSAHGTSVCFTPIIQDGRSSQSS